MSAMPYRTLKLGALELAQLLEFQEIDLCKPPVLTRILSVMEAALAPGASNRRNRGSRISAAADFSGRSRGRGLRISNIVQAQIEQLFTAVAKDAIFSFDVTCLGSLPLKDKVTSLQFLQEPLRQLYLAELANKKLSLGSLDICATGLRVKVSATAISKGASPDGAEENEAHYYALP
ncbi:hypothetical protein KR067_001193 [Drosophila pandora]|nr:hypothetical protein KR067_001193 [Drosophila pandora]